MINEHIAIVYGEFRSNDCPIMPEQSVYVIEDLESFLSNVLFFEGNMKDIFPHEDKGSAARVELNELFDEVVHQSVLKACYSSEILRF